ncbi:pentapeptide repeat-containing protein [Streptomyces niveus]|uniref:pentapeptide repeat-containing protein n=1 Tax=Streptomyces niveus TaxID=193462 RepID=UPI0034314C60
MAGAFFVVSQLPISQRAACPCADPGKRSSFQLVAAVAATRHGRQPLTAPDRPSCVSQPNSAPSPAPPSWPHCGEDVSPERPFGCPGIHVPSHTSCLAHLPGPDRDAYLTGLTPGADIDHRGTPFTPSLLAALLDSMRDPATGHPHLGPAGFASATFEGDVEFESATFTEVAGFAAATFKGDALFGSVTFKGDALFGSVTFKGDALFGSVTFERSARFVSASFESVAEFYSATFKGDAIFESATFGSVAGFDSAAFKRGVMFRSATFQGVAGFGSATFQGGAMFQSATFKLSAWFASVTFGHHTGFRSATFERSAEFGSVTFGRSAEFESATFKGDALFGSVTFKGDALFGSATFERSAEFGSVTFERSAEFESATFQHDARFESATFERAQRLGPLVCAEQVTLSGAMFGGPLILSIAARHLECRRARWSSTAELRLRYATVDFAHAVFEYPLTIAAEPDPFVLPNGWQVREASLTGAPDAVRMASLRGVDAAHLVLADVDLSGCLFTGTVHLDQVRLEGAYFFATVPSGTHWQGWRPVRFTQRRTLAEEHHWRARQPGAVPGWNGAASGAERVGPRQLAPVYRALRKAFEDGKHEPGAADFYYGEMEMRRHADDIPRSERGLLIAYWALAGYGMRASRAMSWLAAAMLVTIVLLMGFGLPNNDPKQEATGTVPTGGGKVTFEIGKDDPHNPTGNRFTGERFEKALNVTLNSVVFRSADQDLTTAGTYMEMTSRLTEPVLLGLAILAVRNRVKR